MEDLNMAEIASAFGALFGWAGASCICAIGCATFLIYTEKVTLNDLKEFFKKKDCWGR